MINLQYDFSVISVENFTSRNSLWKEDCHDYVVSDCETSYHDVQVEPLVR